MESEVKSALDELESAPAHGALKFPKRVIISAKARDVLVKHLKAKRVRRKLDVVGKEPT